MSISKYAEKARLVVEEVEKVIAGKDSCVEKIMMAVLAGGHVLIEDIPGVGKTTLAVAFARAMDLSQRRVQFTLRTSCPRISRDLRCMRSHRERLSTIRER